MDKVRLFALGGLDEDGKNMYVIEINDAIFIVECGLKYPVTDHLGIEMIIPDFTYLQQNENRIKGIFITHGHDDVMGALPSLLKHVHASVYTTPLTAILIERMLRKNGLDDVKIHRIKRNGNFKLDEFTIRTFGTTQSIMDGYGLAIKSNDGYIVYSGEYIIDFDNNFEAFKSNIIDIAKIGSEGVLCLLSESVASAREGHSAPNHRFTPIVEPSFEDTKNRIVVAIFNQNIYRIIEIIELANKYGRKIVFFNNELREIFKEISQLGYYHIPAGLEIPSAEFDNNDENVVVFVSGEGSTVFKTMHGIATKANNHIEFRPTDTIIIAAPRVPGTETEATRMENDLYKEGAKVVVLDSKRTYTMHAAKEDLKTLIYLLNPKYYMPVKGEYRQLITNANIALDMGYRADRIIVEDNGQIATIEHGKLSKEYDSIQLEDVLVDGKDNLDSGGLILKDRETLSTDGVIVAGIVVNYKSKAVIGGPDVQSRGVIYLKDADYLIKEIGIIFEDVINTAVKESRYDNLSCRIEARDKISKYVYKETGKKPMILPAIVEINTKE